MTTPVAAALHKIEGSPVLIDSGWLQAYEGNPDARPGLGTALDQMIDLDYAYEERPDLHAVDAFFLAAGIGDGFDKTIRYYPRELQRAREPYIAIHAAKSWDSRTFPDEFWQELVWALPLPVVWIGAGSDRCYAGGEAMFYRALPAVASIIENAAVVICSDSALLHLAGATETPIVGLFTCVRAARRMPYRHGIMGWRAVGLEAKIGCVGCLEFEPKPATQLTCKRGDNACVRSIDPEDVVYAVKAIAVP